MQDGCCVPTASMHSELALAAAAQQGQILMCWLSVDPLPSMTHGYAVLNGWYGLWGVVIKASSGPPQGHSPTLLDTAMIASARQNSQACT